MQNNVDDDKFFVNILHLSVCIQCGPITWHEGLFEWAVKPKPKYMQSQQPITRHEKKTFKNLWELNIKLIKLPKARENARTKSWVVLVLHLIG